MPQTPGATGVPGEDYTLIPFAPGQTGDEWLLIAGIRIGTADDFTAWGDFVISLLYGTSSLIIDLNGQIEFLTDGSGIAMGSALPQDRIVNFDGYYNGATSTFQASLSADLHFPSLALNLIELIGSMDFLMSPADKHFYVGGPITLGNPPNPPVIENPVTVKVLGIQGPDAAFDTDLNNTTISAKLAEILGFSGSWSLNCGIFSVGVSVSAQEWFQASIAFNAHPFSLQNATAGLGISASVELSFSSFIGSASLGASVSGYLEGTIDSNFNISVSGDLDVSCNVCKIGVTVPIEFSYP